MKSKILILNGFALLLTAVNATLANASGFECKAGIDGMNKPAAFAFTLSDEQPWYDAVLDEENRIRFSCANWESYGEKEISCTIGQVPKDAPQYHMNMTGGAYTKTGIDSKNFSLIAFSFQSIKSDKYTNYTPYVDCKQKD